MNEHDAREVERIRKRVYNINCSADIRSLLSIIDRLNAALVVANTEPFDTPPPGHIIDDTGVVRKVLGTLPLTADGCVVMMGEEVFHPEQDPSFHLEVMPLHPDTEPDKDFPIPEDCEYIGHYSYYERDTGFSQYESYDVRSCYSTSEAAEAARREKP